MFQRPEHTYQIDFSKIDLEEMRRDEASPLMNIVELVPENSKVLDVGAGNGMLGWLFGRLKPSVTIDGVEPNETGTCLARDHYRDFHCAFFQDIRNDILREDYDFIVLADVVEHIADPLAFLIDLAKGLSERTRIVLSIPNIAHYSARLELLNGDFRYVDSGLIERTHLRFMTLDTVRQLAKNAGLFIGSLYYLRRSVSMDGYTGKINLGWLSYWKLFRDRNAQTYQFLVVLSRTEVPTIEVVRGRLCPSQVFKTLFLGRKGSLFRLLKGAKDLLRGRADD